jgi:hypothetical protein
MDGARCFKSDKSLLAWVWMFNTRRVESKDGMLTCRTTSSMRAQVVSIP